MSDVSAAPVAAPAAANLTTATPQAQATPAAEAKAPAKAAAPEYYEVPVDGKIERMTLDEMKRHVSLAKGSNKRFEEAAQMRKEAETLISNLKDPRKAIRTLQDPKFGLSKDQIAEAMEEWYATEVIKPSQMTPEQRELAEAKARLKTYDDAKEAEAKEREIKETQSKEQAEDAEHAKHVQNQVLEALKEANLPKTKFTANRLAYWMRVNESKGINAPAALLVEQVRGEAKKIMSSMLEAADGDVLASLVGDETIKKIRRYDLERIRANRGQSPKPVQANESTQDVNNQEKISLDEVRRRSRDPKLWK